VAENEEASLGQMSRCCGGLRETANARYSNWHGLKVDLLQGFAYKNSSFAKFLDQETFFL
jgi:hypothetical protein